MKVVKKQKKVNKSCYILGGLILFIFGIILFVTAPFIFHWLIYTQQVLSPSASITPDWQKPPVPMTYNVYVFNWTNSEDILNTTIKPKFVELGPYSFVQRRVKEDIVWNENHTVTYKLKKHWYFNPEMSNGTLEDKIITLNPIARSLAYYAKDWNFFSKRGVSLYISNFAKLSTTKTVDELLFNGYDSVLMKYSRPFSSGVVMPDDDKFGYFFERNASSKAEGHFNVATGSGDIKMGRILRWKNSNRTGLYPEKCGEVYGYPQGDILPADSPKTHLDIFSPEQGRVFKLNYLKEVYVKNILGYKYQSQKEYMDNGTLVPENKCFCAKACLPSGATSTLNLLASGIPLYMSYPHFWEADPFYTDSVEGMLPDENKHEMYMTVEPNTGIAIDGATRIQLNLLLEPDDYISIYNNVPRVLIPVFWFEEKGTIPSHLALLLKIFLHVPVIIATVAVLMSAIGFSMIIIATYDTVIKAFKYIVISKRNTKTDNNVKNEEPIKLGSV